MLDYDNSNLPLINRLLIVQGLRVEFQTKDGPVVGVSDVSFNIKSGETVCHRWRIWLRKISLFSFINASG